MQAQRPLLVPWPRQPQGLVPRRKLHSPGPGILGQRDCQHLQHDSLDVVLRLSLCQPQRVDLDPVAEAPLGGVRHAVPLLRELVPELHERPHLAHLLDEAHTGVDEEGDPLDDLTEALGWDLPGVADGVQDGDRSAHGIGDLLHRRRASLLEVVAADVGGVPVGNLSDRVGHHVRNQPQGGLGREDIGPTREVLLDDVILRCPRQRLDHSRRIIPSKHCLLLGNDLVHRQQPHSGGVDGHRGVHPRQRDVRKERPHVADVRDRHADLADLTAGQHMVGVITGLRWKVERDREAGLPLGQVAPEELVARGGTGVAGIRAHDPHRVPVGAVHIWL